MSDEDDFAFDDWDDATLAALNATEQRISYQLTQIQAQPQPAQLDLPIKQSLVRQANFGDPPAKRLKPNNWSPNASSSRYVSLNTGNDAEELEVFAGSDGRARIFDPRVPPRTTSFAVPSKQTTNVPITSVTSNEPVSRRPHAPGRPSPLALQQRPSVGDITAIIRASQGYEEVIRCSEPTVLDSPLDGDHRPPSLVPQSTRTSLSSQQTSNQADNDLARLRADLAQLQAMYEATKKGLQAVQDSVYAKDGEVSTIRRTMTKLTVTHAEAITKLKVEKEALEKSSARKEQVLREEMENLRNHLTLRRQEVETSARKPLWSQQRINSTGTTTPRRPPSLPMQSLNRPSLYKSPAKNPQWQQAGGQSPARRPNKGKEKAKDVPKFPGFINSFLSNTPPHPPKIHLASHRDFEQSVEGAVAPPSENIASSPLSSPIKSVSRPLLSRRLQASKQPTEPLESPAHQGATIGIEMELLDMEIGVDTDMDGLVDEPVDPEDFLAFEPLSPQDELRNVILSHATQPGSQPTLQLLLASQPLDTESLQSYVDACAAVLDSLVSRSVDIFRTLQTLSAGLLTIGEALLRNKSIIALSGLLDILATLSLFLPSFTVPLLTPDEQGNPPSVRLLCGIVHGTFSPASGPLSQEATFLGKAALYMLQAIALTANDDSISELKHFIRGKNTLTQLLNSKQPDWMLQQTVEILAILSMHHILFRTLLAYPEGTTGNQDFTRIPVFERLCVLLNESMPTIPLSPSISLQRNILVYMSQLCIAHEDSFALVMQARSLVPALVIFIAESCCMLWERDDQWFESESAYPIIDNLHQAIYLLHLLAFGSGTSSNVIEKTMQAPLPLYIGAVDMFIVGLGRLSYGDAPDWIDGQAKEALERCSELARDLVECHFQGPEMDAIWAAYQDATEADGGVTDDEEREARESLPANEDFGDSVMGG